MIWLTSDLHLFHDRKFLYGPRGFDSVGDMNDTIVQDWNEKVRDGDSVYILGDVMLNDTERGIETLKSLPGRIYIIIGNHDTDRKVEMYRSLPNVTVVGYACIIKYKKFRIWLCHYYTEVNSVMECRFNEQMFCFFGHTHSRDRFRMDNPWTYNVAMDANDNGLVSIDEVLRRCKEKYDECRNMLQ